MQSEGVVKNAQEQAVAAWVALLNQIRLNALLEGLSRQDANLSDAMDQIDWALDEIAKLVIRNRGGDRGIHGFISEVAECGLENAKSLIQGDGVACEWLNDNGPADLVRNGVKVQMKFCQGNGRYSLDAVAHHLEMYPDFIENGGVYQIPRDFYESVKMLYEMPIDEAKYLTGSDDGPSFSNWKLVHEFFATQDVKIEDLEPSKLDYADAQRGAVGERMQFERRELLEEDKKIRIGLYEESRPTFREAAKVAAVGAALEGATTFAISLKNRVGNGRRIQDVAGDEWIEIAAETGLGFAKGGARGAAVYGLNNFTATPASVASALVTASFGIADCAHKYRNGELGEIEFIEQSEMACLDASVSALSAFIGQAVVPVPVLGALIGNAVGTTVYELGKDVYNKHESEMFKHRAAEVYELDARLDMEYGDCLTRTKKAISEYISVLDLAFAPDVRVSFDGSVALALHSGVPTEEILFTEQDVDDYFLV